MFLNMTQYNKDLGFNVMEMIDFGLGTITALTLKM